VTAARIDPALCLHPRLVEHPLPDKVPLFDNRMRVVMRRKSHLGAHPLVLWRCLECGLVGEKA
jgi:hypothetical protein